MGKNLQQFLNGLLEGLTRPTPVSLFIAVLTLVLVIFSFSPQLFVRIPHEYFIVRPRALEVLASQKTLRLKDASEGSFAVTLIGASSLQEALSEEDEMEQLLAARLQRPVVLTKLAVRGIELFDVIRFVDQLPANYNGIVLICVSIEKYESPLQSMARFPLSSSLYNEQMRKAGFSPPPQTGIFLVDNYRFFSTRSKVLAKALVFGPVEPIAHVSEGVGLSERTGKIKKLITGRAKSLPTLYQKNSRKNYSILSVIFSRLKKSGIHGVYLHPPRNLEFLQRVFESTGKNDYLQNLENDITTYAQSSGITYWNLNDRRFFGYDDFRDFSHISNTEARTRYTEMLLDKLEHMIRTEFKEKG